MEDRDEKSLGICLETVIFAVSFGDASGTEITHFAFKRHKSTRDTYWLAQVNVMIILRNPQPMDSRKEVN